MNGVKLDGLPETPKALNRLAREQMKLRLLNDIRTDMMVCEIEGWSKTEYLDELRELINNLGQEENNVSNEM